MNLLYSFLLCLLSPLAILRLLWKSHKNPEYRKHISERFAHKLPLVSGQPLWVHTVSVGEFLAIHPLLDTLLIKHSSLTLWITCTTPTGREQINTFAQRYRSRITYSYLPYDTKSSINRFIRHCNPLGVVLMETEIWPNLLLEAQKKNIPTLLINARLSKKSLRGYYQFARHVLTKPLSSLIINAQSRQDAKRFHTLCPNSRIYITPNIKFSTSPVRPKPLTEFLPTDNTPLLLAASTHKNEEEQLIHCFVKLRETLPNLRLCIAPRHPERRAELVKLITNNGFNPILRNKKQHLQHKNDIALLDTLGELNQAYASASVAFIGGSLVHRGGHNPLEALHAGCAVCFGPSMFNFQSISENLVKLDFVKKLRKNNFESDIAELLQWQKKHSREEIIAYSQKQSNNVLDKHLEFIEQHINILRVTQKYENYGNAIQLKSDINPPDS